MATRIVFVFVDGLGLGDPEAAENPLRHPELSLLANFLPKMWEPPNDGGRPDSLPEIHRVSRLPFDGLAVATDASLGIPGLPQSATGQTAILTGENAGLVLGRHLNGNPTRTLQRMLMRSSIFKKLVAAKKRALFANAFRPLFFELGETVWTKRMSATTWANRAGGLPFQDLDMLRKHRAVYQDITHDSLIARGIDIELRSPETAGKALATLSRSHDFILFEFFQTDKAGHAQDSDKAEYELLKLERFLNAALSHLDLSETTLILTSDHGNIEDLGTKSHTLNPVPTLVFGAGAATIVPGLDRLERFSPVMLEHMGVSGDGRALGTTPAP